MELCVCVDVRAAQAGKAERNKVGASSVQFAVHWEGSCNFDNSRKIQTLLVSTICAVLVKKVQNIKINVA